jgi:hypothetical protein
VTSFRRFSLLILVIGVTAASAGLAYLRARLYSQQPYAQRVHGIVRGAIPVEPFRLGLVQRIEDLGYKRCDNAEAQALASYRMVHNNCQG